MVVKKQPAPEPTPVSKPTGKPRCLIDRGGHICIEVLRNSGGVHFIQMGASNLHLQRIKATHFDYQWHTELTPKNTKSWHPKDLAARLLEHGEKRGITPDAKIHLQHIASTGEWLTEAPELPRKPLPEALRQHQFKKTTPEDFTVKLTPNGGSSKLQASSARAQLVEWLKGCTGKSASISSIESHFKKDMKGVVQKLQEKGWIVIT